MTIGRLHVGPVIPVSDLDASLAFYRDQLGLTGAPVPSGYRLDAGGNSVVYLLTGTSYAGTAEWPLASFVTDRLDTVVQGLVASGVDVEHIADGPQQTDENGIASLDGLRIAWIRDPDHQVISIFEPVAG